MSPSRNVLPQLSNELFLTDGGLETTLVFHHGIDLPEFAAFVLLETEYGCEVLRNYYRAYADTADKYSVGFILESMTWRASKDWGEKIGYKPQQLVEINFKGIQLLKEIRCEYENRIPSLVISGCMGPRGLGYSGDESISVEEAKIYHREQLAAFREAGADMAAAFTIPNSSEAIGIALAAQSEDMPLVISFTTETNGKLPSGEPLRDAIEKVDAVTDSAPAYYMINCAHPSHFFDVLDANSWTKRIQGIRANASCKSHEELDESTELDEGNREELALEYQKLRQRLENLNVLGGCCGTDHRHIEEICEAFINTR